MALPVSDGMWATQQPSIGIFRYQPRKGCASPNQESCDTSSVYIMQLFRGTRHWNTRIRIHSPEGQAKKAAAMMSMLSDKQWHVQASGRNTCQQRMMIWDIKITMLKKHESFIHIHCMITKPISVQDRVINKYISNVYICKPPRHHLNNPNA
ncbi:unnamed protein product [Fusarium graminearum]|uniref:Uncharacterized protein n=1 Tax=Gibberella zeae TaxID=5518 RepID=A0A9N8R968_GIBZA|nr:unnamed protein product [Fusarium graminearum]CAG1975389.1 unnamed protein product [Fusarium graminearum]